MFNADDIEKLDYDFSGFYDGGPSGIVPEPSTEAISAYQLAMSNLMAETLRRIKAAVGSDVEEKKDGPVTVPTLDEEDDTGPQAEQHAEVERINNDSWTQRKYLLAELCQQTPSFDEINKLGHRVFEKFEDYVLGKWTPQASSVATS